MVKPRPEQPDDDLIQLGPDTTEVQITERLNERFSKDIPYTRIGENVLIAINPYKRLEINAEDSAKSYGNAVKDGQDRAPHVFELATGAYYEMLKSKKEQSIVFLGESGSGKSESFNLALQSLVAVSKSKKKEEKVSGRVLQVNTILDSFGNAKTSSNNNSSRFGKNVDLQFNARGKLSGLKVSDYLLETTRVTEIPYGERGFHVFYQILAGASHEEKQKWHLHDASRFNFLHASKTYKAGSIDDASRFSELKSALKSIGVKDKYQQQVFQLLASILNLGNLEFSLGEHRDEAAIITNHELLDVICDMLGVKAFNLENALVYKTKLIKKEICTIFLDPEEASVQRDTMCRTLYAVLWSWIVESINKKLCDELPSHNLSLVDMPGFENLKSNYLHQALYNFTAEKFLAFFNEVLFDREIEVYRNENVSFPEVSYGDNSKIMDLFIGEPYGVFTLMDAESSGRKKGKISRVLETLEEQHESNEFFVKFPKKSKNKLFGIRHHVEDVHYDAKDFMETNTETITPDFVSLFRGDSDIRPSRNAFVAGLFSEKILHLETAPNNDNAVVNALLVNEPRRKPVKRTDIMKKAESMDDSSFNFTSRYRASLNDLVESLSATKVSFVLCVKPNSNASPNRFEAKLVQDQVSSYGLPDVVRMRSQAYNVRETYEALADRCRLLDTSGALEGNSKENIKGFLKSLGFIKGAAAYGNHYVFLSEGTSREIVKKLRAAEKEERRRIKAKVTGGAIDDNSQVGSNVSSYIPDDGQSDYSEDDGSQAMTADVSDAEMSDAGSDYTDYSYISGMTAFEKGEEFGQPHDEKGVPIELHAEEEEQPMSSARRWWLRITNVLTCCICTKCLEWNGMKRSDIQQAWREKVAICILIALLSALMLFFIAGFSLILCPGKNMNNLQELAEHKDATTDCWVGVYGNVIDYTGRRLTHPISPEITNEYCGTDSTNQLFPRTSQLCGKELDPLELQNFTHAHSYESVQPVFSSRNKKEWKGWISYKSSEILQNYQKASARWVIYEDQVYDMTFYADKNLQYLDNRVTRIILQNPGQDITRQIDTLKNSNGNFPVEVRESLKCMNTVHFVGVIDTRDSPQCIFANSILLAATGVLVGIMVVKFLAALQLGTTKTPEDHDRFVICQVPCYTEGEESLRRTLDSLATLKYDDKRKLIMIIADGNIVGSGNDRATWRIALDLLGVDPSIDPPKLSFQSLGEGNKQHNMGKVYTGLYDCTGHLVPYMVVVKVGKDNETRRPGNRGKRDSQMLLMRFLQKVHYDDPMSPLELEMYHQMKNVIGVDPSFYEFILMVDADTEVTPDSLNRMVSCMVNDSKILGLCGETALANEKESWITMIQVYEYYISHVMAKAFESLFGSVTCLPGCFCMYRIRTPNKSIPLLISKQIVADYAVNDVDTLHKKNLLSLGEDRYLTTLMLKHFPNMKLSFTQDAHCRTYAPDRWSVLLSQRRRWINSTVHNLSELLLLPQLCGFCCFSMRFVAFFDLFATLVMPAAMAYLGYLIYAAVNNESFPLVSLILLAAAYGFQIIIFLLKRRWEFLGWLVIYLLALPLFTFFIPLYSFWHFDDFSWGNTRIVVGEKGGKKQIVDEEPFDPATIPMKKWSEYEQEVWERESQMTGSAAPSQLTAPSYHHLVQVAPPAVLQYEMAPPTYTASVIGSQQQQMGMMQRPPSVHSTGRTRSINSPIQAAPDSIYPSDEQIVSQVKTILSTANLMTVTKKQVRDELSLFFGVDLNARKTFVNKVIEDVLQGKM